MSAEDRKYQEVRPFSDIEVLEALNRDVAQELSVVVIGVSMYHPNLNTASTLCTRLANHKDPTVRGNAILGFGHLARRFQMLDEATIKPIIESGLVDPFEYVRGQAWTAVDDLEHFLNWAFERPR